MNTETFREEHYELDAMLNGAWQTLAHGISSLEEAKQFVGLIHEPTRIIKCTTVREVV